MQTDLQPPDYTHSGKSYVHTSHAYFLFGRICMDFHRISYSVNSWVRKLHLYSGRNTHTHSSFLKQHVFHSHVIVSHIIYVYLYTVLNECIHMHACRVGRLCSRLPIFYAQVNSLLFFSNRLLFPHYSSKAQHWPMSLHK